MRFSLALVAMLVSAAHLFAGFSAETPQILIWLEIEVVVYIVISIIYLLGLKMWYIFAILFSCLNIILFFTSAIIPIPFISNGVLTGNLAFSQYTFGQAFALSGWIYLIIMTILLNKIDRGSRLNELLLSQ